MVNKTMKHTSVQRTTLLKKNILASFLMKGWSAFVVLLMVPVTLHCLGEYKNGVWLTISSLLLWIDNMDIGLGNGMRNKLTFYLAQDNLLGARSLISSTFAMLTVIIIPTLTILLILIWTTDTYKFFNVDVSQVDHLKEVLMITVILVCTTFVFKLIGNFYMGLQLPAVNNLLISLGQTVALLGTYIVYLSQSHSLMMIAIVNTGASLLVYLTSIPITFYCLYPNLRPSLKLINLHEAKAVASMGIQFFIMQISSLILFATSNILISNFFSPSMVTPYQITYRYFSVFMVIFTVICMPYWNATTDAYTRGDIEWIRQATGKLKIMTIAILLGMMFMVAISSYVYDFWIGEEVNISFPMTIVMALYIFILIYSMRYSYFINGIGTLRLQIIFTTGAAILFIPLAYWITMWKHDIIYFMLVMCAINTPGVIVNRIQFQKLINGSATGIWKK